jgi:hypothetical protein
MKVAELIRLLSTARPDSEVWLEGCDCVGECVGATELKNPAGIMDVDGGYTLYLRVKDGVLGWDEPPPAIHRNSVRQSNNLG